MAAARADGESAPSLVAQPIANAGFGLDQRGLIGIAAPRIEL
jgi:hypothetical protein